MKAAPGAVGGPRPGPRWELGSEFHLLLEAGEAAPRPPWGERALLLGSGRDALCLLLRHARRERGWRRLWVPSYFCPEVSAAARATGIDVRVYPCLPFSAAPAGEARAGPGEAVLRVSYFGLGAAAPMPELAGAELIEDHTHDPWAPGAYASAADFCIASLRKTLPLPDGGVLWSPAAHRLPAAPPHGAEHRAVAAQKLSAMTLKALYLAGGAVDKAAFRRLAVEAEGRIGSGPASAMSEVAQALLHALPLARWRTRRRDNHRFLSAQLAAVPGLRVAAPQDPEGCSPLSAILLFATPELRERVRSALLARDIYPAILWPLDDAPEAGARERALSHTLLSLPCDMRYGEPDLARAAAQVRAAAAEQPAWSAAP